MTLLACFKAGIVPACSLPQHREVEIAPLTGQSGARVHFVEADFGSFDQLAFAQEMRKRQATLEHVVVVRGSAPGLPNIQSLIDNMPRDAARQMLADVPLGAGDVLSLQPSGGTTGIPKIIPRFHTQYQGHAAGWMRVYGIEPDSRVLWSLPLIHNDGQLYH